MKCEDVFSRLSFLSKLKDKADTELCRCRLNVSDQKALHAQSEVDCKNATVALEVAKAAQKKLTSEFWHSEAEIEILRLQANSPEVLEGDRAC